MKTYNYVSPVKLLLDITKQLNTNLDNAILQVVHNVGIEVDKEELRKALLADYSRCEKAYWEGRRDAVVHAKWIKNEGRHGWHCSECMKDNRYAYAWSRETGSEAVLQDHYCFNCGAKMDKETDHAD